jgi:hypothetical protein
VTAISTSEYKQVSLVLDHSKVGPSSWATWLSSPEDDFPLEGEKVKGVYISQVLSFLAEVAPIDIHFVLDDYRAVGVDLWKIDIGLLIPPFLSNKIVDINLVASYSSDNLSPEDYEILLVGDSWMSL